MKIHRQTPVSPAQSSSTYGIHALKANALFFQILAHAHIWASQNGLFLFNASPFWTQVAMGLGDFAMTVPMTAGAVLRMMCETDDQDRVVNINWSSFLQTMALLALFESVKDGLVYSPADFFTWNVLQLIAVTMPLMLFIASFGMAYLWSVALTIICGAPAVIEWISDYDPPLMGLPDPPVGIINVVGITFTFIFLAALVFTGIKIVHSSAFTRKHKYRMLALLGGTAIAGTALLLPMKYDPLFTYCVKTLWVGALAGTQNGFHLWGFFPWAGTIMIGFLIYDAILRTKASPILLGALIVAGTIMLIIFFSGDASLAITGRSQIWVLSGFYMNRVPGRALLTIGLFCLGTPIAYGAMRMGWEKGYVVKLSRCILWIYIYQTSFLLIAARLLKRVAPDPSNNLTLLYTVFALASSLALPIVLQKIPFTIHLQFRKRP
jgi:hypothetical protein